MKRKKNIEFYYFKNEIIFTIKIVKTKYRLASKFFNINLF